MRLVADVWVAGLPATKGSVNVNRGGRGVRQAASGYELWSDVVRQKLVKHRDGRAAAMLDCRLQRHEGAMVRCRFWVPRPAAAGAYGGLWAPRVGDGDKLERAVWDAVTKAQLWQDDAQAIEWSGSRRWAGVSFAPGVHIMIWAVSAAEVEADGTPVREATPAYVRAMGGGA